MKRVNIGLMALTISFSWTPPRNVTATTIPAESETFEFRICFEGNHARCFEGRTKPGLIRQYGGRTDSEAPASAKSIAELTADIESVLKATEPLLKNVTKGSKGLCVQPLKFELRRRERVICLDKLEFFENKSARKNKVLPRILALLEKLSLQSKPK